MIKILLRKKESVTSEEENLRKEIQGVSSLVKSESRGSGGGLGRAKGILPSLLGLKHVKIG